MRRAISHSARPLCCSTLGGDHGSPVHSTADGHLDGFQVFVIAGSTTTDILIYVVAYVGENFSWEEMRRRLASFWCLINFYFIDHTGINHPFARRDLTVIAQHIDSQI